MFLMRLIYFPRNGIFAVNVPRAASGSGFSGLPIPVFFAVLYFR
jgi:hypothetical protein